MDGDRFYEDLDTVSGSLIEDRPDVLRLDVSEKTGGIPFGPQRGASHDVLPIFCKNGERNGFSHAILKFAG
jgi:hypothetical protein